MRRTLIVGLAIAVICALSTSAEADPVSEATLGTSLRPLTPLLAAVFAASAAGSWCSTGTERLLCLWSPTRARLFGVEILTTALVVAALAMILFAQITVAMTIRAAIEGAALQPHLDALVDRAGEMVLACVLAAVFGASLGLLVRSSGAALGTIAALYVVVEPLLASSGRESGIDILTYTPVLSFAALAGSSDVGTAGGMQLAATWWAAAIWTLIVLGVASQRMVRRDLP
jgi:ABC-2 type transport system permease protein